MRNRYIVFLLAVSLAVTVISCTRSSTVEELSVEENSGVQGGAPAQRKSAADVMPEEEMPDVKIDPRAEIPSSEGITNVKVPDVKIDATEGIGNIDETRVDGADEIVDEP